MATLEFIDAKITINSQELSSSGNSVNINYEAEVLDETAFGDTTRINKGGLKNWTMEIVFHQNYAASEVDVTMFSIVGTVVAVSILPTSAGAGATNPDYNGNGLITSYTPISGSVGELLPATVSIVSAGNLDRGTS